MQTKFLNCNYNHSVVKFIFKEATNRVLKGKINGNYDADWRIALVILCIEGGINRVVNFDQLLEVWGNSSEETRDNVLRKYLFMSAEELIELNVKYDFF